MNAPARRRTTRGEARARLSSGTFTVRRVQRHHRSVPARAIIVPRSEAPSAACGVVGLLAFPLAGAALIGHLIGPLLYVGFASVAATMVVFALNKLDKTTTTRA